MSILVSDYDGTLFTDERNMRINCRYLRDFIEDGNYFVLSSGRSFESLMGRINEYNIPFTHLSCCDGSFLYNDTRLFFAYPVDPKAVHIFDPLIAQNKHKKVEYSYSDRYDTEYSPNEMIGSVALTITRDKIDSEFLKVYEKIKRAHPEYQYDIYAYGDEVYYLIRPHGISKSTPIRFLQNDLGILKEDVYTIGDNTNDRELIKDYNGYRIGSNKDIIDVALKEYNAVHELIDDINKGKVLRRW